MYLLHIARKAIVDKVTSMCRPHVLGMSLLGQWYLDPIKDGGEDQFTCGLACTGRVHCEIISFY